MSARARRVLPTRPRPPGAEQLREDVSGSRAADPVLAPPAEPAAAGGEGGGARGAAEPPPAALLGAGAAEGVESLFGQSRRYVELNQRLQESGGRLRAGCEGLRRAGTALDLGLARLRRSACWGLSGPEPPAASS
ncbi:UPF0449 protein C19orf25 homolog [Nothoprocta perdicaria]|uniref:UPF0449 protein C19orf25 homolog n=1 Tax=Nothoprocta perdicaria TaxID=30464 RepID=UPI000E1BDA5C|nr:UPF0449 protein C19orf25 homolog [Nothoprocta perdicaria]